MEKQSDGRVIKHPEFGVVKFTRLTLRQQDVLDYLVFSKAKVAKRARLLSTLKRMSKRYPNDAEFGSQIRKLL